MTKTEHLVHAQRLDLWQCVTTASDEIAIRSLLLELLPPQALERESYTTMIRDKTRLRLRPTKDCLTSAQVFCADVGLKDSPLLCRLTAERP